MVLAAFIIREIYSETSVSINQTRPDQIVEDLYFEARSEIQKLNVISQKSAIFITFRRKNVRLHRMCYYYYYY
jgi:hypothetical protein